MNNKFLSQFFLILISGIFVGYAGNYLINSPSNDSSSTGENKDSVRHRFGDSLYGKKTSLQRKENPHKTKTSLLHEFDKKLLRLTQMSPTEMQTEMDKICKKADSPSHLSAHDQLAFSFLCSRLGQKIPLQILKQIDECSKYNENFKKHILNVWCNRNPEAAMAYCLDDNNPRDPLSYSRIIAKSSLDTAFGWIKELSKEKKNLALCGFFEEAAASHPERLGEFIQKLGDCDNAYGMKSNAAKQWIKIDKEAALKWINLLPDEQKMEIRASALSELSQEDAKRELSSLKVKSKALAIAEIANTLGKKSGEQAIEWVMQNTDSDPKILEKIIPSLRFDNFDTSLQNYLTQMPKGEMKDSFMSEAVNRWIIESNEDRLQDLKMEDVVVFASKIDNNEKRENSIDLTIYRWIYKNPEEALQWLDKSDLSPEKKKEYIERCNWSFLNNQQDT